MGDYLIPDIRLREDPDEAAPLGRYARLRKEFLQKHRRITYSRLILTEKLYQHLREVDESATARLEQMMEQMAKKSGLPDRATDQMAWVAAMNALKTQAEEVIMNDLIYA
jgi:predicted nucleic acid-binding protein